MKHDRFNVFAIFINIETAEAVRQVDVELNRAALPGTSHGVAEFEIEIRSVESAIARVDLIFMTRIFAGLRQNLFGFIPEGDLADKIIGAGRKNDAVAKAENVIDFIEDTHDVLHFAFDLVAAEQDVSIVLGNRADAEQSI